VGGLVCCGVGCSGRGRTFLTVGVTWRCGRGVVFGLYVTSLLRVARHGGRRRWGVGDVSCVRDLSGTTSVRLCASARWVCCVSRALILCGGCGVGGVLWVVSCVGLHRVRARFFRVAFVSLVALR